MFSFKSSILDFFTAYSIIFCRTKILYFRMMAHLQNLYPAQRREKISHSHLELLFKFCKQVLEERGWIIWLRNALQTHVHILTTLYTLSK